MPLVSEKVGSLIAGGWPAAGAGTLVFEALARTNRDRRRRKHCVGPPAIVRFLLAVALFAAIPIAEIGATASAGFVLPAQDGKTSIDEDGDQAGAFNITPDWCRRSVSP